MSKTEKKCTRPDGSNGSMLLMHFPDCLYPLTIHWNTYWFPREWNSPSLSDAKSLLIAMTACQFIATLHTTWSILAYVQPLSTGLQSNAEDMIKAMFEVVAIMHALEGQRQNVDEFRQELFGDMVATGNDVNAQPAAPRILNRTNAPAETIEQHYKRNISIPVVDKCIDALRFRFGQQQREYLQALSIIPSVLLESDRLEWKYREMSDIFLLHIEMVYPIENMHAELHIWLNWWSRPGILNPPQTAAAALKVIKPAFSPNIYTLLNSLRPSDAYTRHWTGPSLVQIMACRLFGAKPLSEPMMEYS